ncbi:MbtH family protein [Actinospica durhamensis]|uniref:MbtH family protein n=1 Tax=Actinospica durhamensis TaxID=1508375 RepID=A0A941INR8_9ACTN|nr:MbtH family protein [Actinospica durhamensis]MBR7835710.1 MbtH family protein [Actinospica durhamensis]
MTNPFEEPDADYSVLRNSQNQHSLWPAVIAVPDGWTAVYGPGLRADCLASVREHWVDLRPSDVAEFLAAVSR